MPPFAVSTPDTVPYRQVPSVSVCRRCFQSTPPFAVLVPSLPLSLPLSPPLAPSPPPSADIIFSLGSVITLVAAPVAAPVATLVAASACRFRHLLSAEKPFLIHKGGVSFFCRYRAAQTPGRSRESLSVNCTFYEFFYLHVPCKQINFESDSTPEHRFFTIKYRPFLNLT